MILPGIMLASCFTLYRHCITLHHRGVMLATPLSSFYYHYCITLDDMRGTAKPVKIKFRRTWITLYHPGVMLASCLYNLYHLDASIFLVTPCIRLVSPYIILVWCLHHQPLNQIYSWYISQNAKVDLLWRSACHRCYERQGQESSSGNSSN